MDVSVVIVNYNTFALTCACIQSVISKTNQASYEIILVDNRSTDVEPQEFLKLFPNLVLVKSQSNVGFARGCNLGIALAKGSYVLLLNSDTILKNDAVEICKNFLDKATTVAVVSARLEDEDGTSQHNCQRFPSLSYRLFELLRVQKLLPDRLAGKILFGFFFDHQEVAYPDWVWGTFFMFRRSLLESLPGNKLADDFFMYVEDMQWCKEFRMLGYRIAFEPAAIVVHHMGQSGATREEWMERNTERFLRKYYSPIHMYFLKWFDTY